MLKKILVWAAVPVFVSTVTAYALLKISFRKSISAQEPVSTVAKPTPVSIRAGVLWPQLRFNLHALGNRLEEPGKERLTVAGALDRVGEVATFSAVFELPDHLRASTQSATEARTVIYDGQTATVAGDTVNDSDKNLIESLVRDSAEHFFNLQAQGAPTRQLGRHTRMDDGSSVNYEGPLYDVYSVTDPTSLGRVKHSLSKLYYFSSETHLLERVTYQISRNGEIVEVETRFVRWQKIDNQQVAQQVVRLENGKQVFALTLTSTGIGPRANDALFE